MDHILFIFQQRALASLQLLAAAINAVVGIDVQAWVTYFTPDSQGDPATETLSPLYRE